MPFAIPRVWREPQKIITTVTSVQYCIAKYRKVKGRRALTYPRIPLSIALVPHSETLPVLNPPPNISNYAIVIVVGT